MKTTHIVSAVVLAGSLLLSGCKDLTGDLPAGVVDPNFYRTPEAAQQMAQYARFEFQAQWFEFIRNSGGLTDELRADTYGGPVGVFDSDYAREIDSRYLPEVRSPASVGASRNRFWGNAFAGYSGLQRLRSVVAQARAALHTYALDTAVRGEMFLYEGFAVVMLADLFCSGVPLTTVDFEQDFTYRPGSSTADLYRHAVGLFDSAISLSGADARIQSAARVGKGRALLSLSQYDDAGSAVVGISNGFAFTVPLVRKVVVRDSASWEPFVWATIWDVRAEGSNFRYVADREGGNGEPFITGNDPRISLTRGAQPNNRYAIPNWYPSIRQNLVVASHIEARLIQAEAALQAGRAEWLDLLNALRTDRTFTITGTGDTLWQPGTGGVAGLPPLDDPALLPFPLGKDTLAVRLDLVFRERAYWLFLTGHRQGDLRRLVREYGRRVDQTYPWGSYPGATGVYHGFIDLPIPEGEQLNPLFTGCLRRDG